MTIRSLALAYACHTTLCLFNMYNVYTPGSAFMADRALCTLQDLQLQLGKMHIPPASVAPRCKVACLVRDVNVHLKMLCRNLSLDRTELSDTGRGNASWLRHCSNFLTEERSPRLTNFSSCL